MKKIIAPVLFCICSMSLHAQDTCLGTNAFYPLKMAMRMGNFISPNGGPDSISCYSAAFGSNTKAMGYSSIAMGNNAVTRGDYSFAGGSYSTASGQNATAIGLSTLSSGLNSFASGGYSTASGTGSFAAGNNTLSSGENSFASGYYTKASGNYSFASGSGAWATGDNSFASGALAKAFGYNSFAPGPYSMAVASGSVSMGFGSKAFGAYSAALGYNAFTSGDMSMSAGYFTKTQSFGGMAVGTYNDSTVTGSMVSIASTNRIFQIGNGTADNARSNAVTVLQNGNVGLGVLNPISRLHMRGEMSFSSSSKTWQLAYDSVNHYFYIDELGVARRLFIKDGGKVGIGMNPVHNLDVAGTIRGSTDILASRFLASNDVIVDFGGYNSGNQENSLRFGYLQNGGAIGSKRTGFPESMLFGLDFYTNNINRMAISNAGNVGIGNDNPGYKLDVAGSVRFSGNMLVQSNKGIIRSNDATQQKKLTTSFFMTSTFSAGQTKSFAITWPETFSAVPDAFVGNITSGAGGWAEVVLSLADVTSTGATLFVFNARNATVTPNFTVKIIAIGAQ